MVTNHFFFRLVFFCMLLCAGGCATDDVVEAQPFVIAFEAPSINYLSIQEARSIGLVFSESAPSSGELQIQVDVENATYGVDFLTVPAAVNGMITLPFSEGQTQGELVFQNLIYPFDHATKKITFTIRSMQTTAVYAIQGYSKTVVSFESALGGIVSPAVGGPNQGNQVYFDFKTQATKLARRDSWDLGFYNGDDNRVFLNSSVYMAAKALGTTDLLAVNASTTQAAQNEVAVGTFQASNMAYIDHPSGVVSGNAMGEVLEIPTDNQVYLVNMGFSVGTLSPVPGSVAIAGQARGFYKIRVQRTDDGYLLQYAPLAEQTIREVHIVKNPAYNFQHYSLVTHALVEVEPEKTNWDICFTVFTNEIAGSGSYGYSDFVVNNLKADVKGYKINGSTNQAYDNFTLADVQATHLQHDQRVIGADWRDVFSGSVYPNLFYVLRDAEGNWYKFRMLGFVNTAGERGYPQFEYALLY